MTWIIVGLGNPGEDYTSTRHNAGRMAVSFAAEKNNFTAWKEDSRANAHIARGEVGGTPAIAVLPNTFMNKSGAAAAKFVKSVKAAEKLIVAYDDLDLPLGSIKLSYDRGSGGHRGLESMMRTLKTKKFTRIRIGVSPETAGGKLKKPQGEADVLKFILNKFKPSELDELKKVFKRVNEAVVSTIASGPMVAMNEFNRG